MLSLRSFHIFFVVIAILMADVFGIWAVWDYASHGRLLYLLLGVISLVGGMAMIGYGIWFVRKVDQARIH